MNFIQKFYLTKKDVLEVSNGIDDNLNYYKILLRAVGVAVAAAVHDNKIENNDIIMSDEIHHDDVLMIAISLYFFSLPCSSLRFSSFLSLSPVLKPYLYCSSD